MWATARTVTLLGAVGHVIDVQVDVSQGVVATALVGRPDVAITEARDRCRAAMTNSGHDWPTTRRVTILLSPADLPKRGPHFDLAIALGVLAAHDPRFPRAALDDAVLIGELTLDGRLRCVPGVLPMVMAASARGLRRVYVPEPQVAEAAMVPGTEVYGARSLNQIVALLRGLPLPDAPVVEPLTGNPLLSWRGEERLDDLDMSDVDGMADARYALEVSAAGGHSLMLVGPKGAGKTTLAERLPTLLPDLEPDEALELTAVHSLSGTLPHTLMRRPPFRAPHHSVSRTGILGGGTGRVRPGEVSKAHLGVLFLDEFPLFHTDIIEALRQPLESGEITIARGEEEATYPARALVVLAANPCPCGAYHPVRRESSALCDCVETRRREYRRKLAGPVADRIDISRFVEQPQEHELRDPFALREDSATIRARVSAARLRQAERYASLPWRLNAHVPGPVLTERWPASDEAMAMVRSEVIDGRLTRRGATRVHRLAWTVADLRGRRQPALAEMAAALALRTSQPLPHHWVSGRELAG
jgi:magnesium chelatase family protein